MMSIFQRNEKPLGFSPPTNSALLEKFEKAKEEQAKREERLLEESKERNLKVARLTRDTAIYRFKRDYFLTPGRDLESEDAERTLSKIVSHLYPEVTEETVDDYINRSW
jgi:hypothetical protein